MTRPTKSMREKRWGITPEEVAKTFLKIYGPKKKGGKRA